MSATKKRKIAVISFDYYSYDSYIVQALNKIEYIKAHHIDFSKIKYTYPNLASRIYNFYSKTVLKQNLKKNYIEEQILEKLHGHYDDILIMRPDRLSLSLLQQIRARCNQLICYFYDSSSRFDIKKYMETKLFDKVYTFDKADAEEYQIPWISNYIFWDKADLNTHPKYDIFMISSIDERLEKINKMAEFASKRSLKLNFSVVGKLKGKSVHPSIINTRKTQKLEDIKPIMYDSFSLLDLVRKDQKGLSFRPFEALALQKKLITNNAIIKKYPFYSTENIFLIENDNLDIPSSFFETEYQPIPSEIYHQYTVETWVNKVFELNS